MKFLPGQLWLILKKEVLHCLREPHVLVVNILLPLLAYPLLLMIVMEGVLLETGRFESTICRVIVSQPATMQLNSLSYKLIAKNIDLCVAADPKQALSNELVDAILTQKSPQAKLVVTLHEESERARTVRSRIEETAADFRLKSLQAYRHNRELPEKFLTPFKVVTKNLDSLGTALLPEITAIILGFATAGAAAGAAYPTVAALVEEREKRTLETTLLLPVGHLTLVFAKFLAVAALALLSGLINVLGIVLVLLVLLIQAGPVALRMAQGALLPFIACLFVVSIALILTAITITALDFLFIAPSRSLKEAQSRAQLALLITMLPPLFFIFPTLNLDNNLALVPLLNIGLLVKALIKGTAGGTATLLATTESIVLTVSILWLTQKTFLANAAPLTGPNLRERNRTARTQST